MANEHARRDRSRRTGREIRRFGGLRGVPRGHAPETQPGVDPGDPFRARRQEDVPIPRARASSTRAQRDRGPEPRALLRRQGRDADDLGHAGRGQVLARGQDAALGVLGDRDPGVARPQLLRDAGRTAARPAASRSAGRPRAGPAAGRTPAPGHRSRETSRSSSSGPSIRSSRRRRPAAPRGRRQHQQRELLDLERALRPDGGQQARASRRAPTRSPAVRRARASGRAARRTASASKGPTRPGAAGRRAASRRALR